jgi:hypothetical protein
MGREGPTPTTRRQTAAQRERRAAAALVRRVVEEACKQGNLAVLDELLAGALLRFAVLAVLA